MSKTLLTVKEAASYLRVHPNTLYKWVAEEKIPYLKFNGLLRFEIDKVMESQPKPKQNNDLLNLLPKLDLSIENYDRMLLKGDGAVSKKKQRWNYGIGGVYIRKTKSESERWYIWFYDKNRKRIQKVVKNAKTRQEAVLAMNMEVTREFNQEYQPEKGKRSISFREFSDVYLTNYAKPKKRSWESDQKYIEAQLTPFFCELKLAEITPLHVSQFIVKRQRDGVRNSTVNRELTVLKKMLSLAIEWDFEIERNPVRKGNYFSEEQYKRDRVLTFDEEKRLFKEAALHLKPILTCALCTGMRLSEILSLKWRFVDFSNRKIIIRAETSKSGKQRMIPVNRTLNSILTGLKRKNAEKSDYVFLYEDPRNGKLRPIKTVRRSFVMACKRACIKNLRFHDLRHTFGTRLIEKGVDPVSIKDLLGHANLKTTDIYLHSSLKRMKEAVALLDGKTDLDAKNLDKLLRICNISGEKNQEGRVNVLFSVN